MRATYSSIWVNSLVYQSREFYSASVVNFLMRYEVFSFGSSKKSYMGVIMRLITTVISLAYQHHMVGMYDFHI